MSEPFDRFLIVSGLYTLNSLRKLTGYEGIAEKPHVDHLPRNYPCTL